VFDLIKACLICELGKAWLVSHVLRSVQDSLFDFLAALEPVLVLSVFDLHPAARPNHNPSSFPSQNR
jgi:hypothetical protein